jgi:hypothetical protein
MAANDEKMADTLREIIKICDEAEVGRKGIALDRVAELATATLEEYAKDRVQ